MIRDIGGLSGTGPDYFIMNFVTSGGNTDCSGKVEEYDIVNGRFVGSPLKGMRRRPRQVLHGSWQTMTWTELFSKNFRPRSINFMCLGKGYTGKYEGKSTWVKKKILNLSV